MDLGRHNRVRPYLRRSKQSHYNDKTDNVG